MQRGVPTSTRNVSCSEFKRTLTQGGRKYFSCFSSWLLFVVLWKQSYLVTKTWFYLFYFVNLIWLSTSLESRWYSRILPIWYPLFVLKIILLLRFYLHHVAGPSWRPLESASFSVSLNLFIAALEHKWHHLHILFPDSRYQKPLPEGDFWTLKTWLPSLPALLFVFCFALQKSLKKMTNTSSPTLCTLSTPKPPNHPSHPSHPTHSPNCQRFDGAVASLKVN